MIIIFRILIIIVIISFTSHQNEKPSHCTRESMNIDDSSVCFSCADDRMGAFAGSQTTCAPDVCPSRQSVDPTETAASASPPPPPTHIPAAAAAAEGNAAGCAGG